METGTTEEGHDKKKKISDHMRKKRREGEEVENKKKRRKPSRTDIKEDLLCQLERNGTCGEYYTDLVEDYMKMYEIKEQYLKDIKKRGVVVEYTSNNGTINKRKNDSTELLLKTNTQMLKILQCLGIKAVVAESAGDAGDDIL